MLALITLVVSEPAGASAFPGENGKIAFASKRAGGGDFDIYAFSSHGAPLGVLTNDPANDYAPAWSPDGTRIAYQSADEIFTMDANGGHKVQLTNNPPGNFGPSFSPGGNKIAYVKVVGDFGGNAWQIYTMNTDGGGMTQLTNYPAKKFYPTYSPDGTKIAYSAFDGNDYEIYAMNADGTGVHPLTDNTTNDGVPSYSPDGTKIAYGSRGDQASNPDGDWEIYVMNATDGSGKKNLTDNNTYD